MSDWWVFLILVVVAALVLFFFVAMMVAGITASDVMSEASSATSQPAHDDVECACCGLSPLESVRSTTGQDACICCGRRPYRVRPRRARRRAGRRDED